MSRVKGRKRYSDIRHTFEDGTCSVCGESLEWLLARRWGRMGAYRGRKPVAGQTELQLTLTVPESSLRHQRTVAL